LERFVRGDVVVLPFPFSDLTESKRHPALVLAELDGDDRILCQIRSILPLAPRMRSRSRHEELLHIYHLHDPWVSIPGIGRWTNFISPLLDTFRPPLTPSSMTACQRDFMGARQYMAQPIYWRWNCK